MLLEAGACGLPLVAYDVSGSREVISNGKNGFLVKLHDIDALVNVLYKLIVNEDLRKSMGLESRKIVEDNFSQDIIRKQTNELWMEIGQ